MIAPVGAGAMAVSPVVVGTAEVMRFSPTYATSAKSLVVPIAVVRLLLKVLVPVHVLFKLRMPAPIPAIAEST